MDMVKLILIFRDVIFRSRHRQIDKVNSEIISFADLLSAKLDHVTPMETYTELVSKH